VQQPCRRRAGARSGKYENSVATSSVEHSKGGEAAHGPQLLHLEQLSAAGCSGRSNWNLRSHQRMSGVGVFHASYQIDLPLRPRDERVEASLVKWLVDIVHAGNSCDSAAGRRGAPRNHSARDSAPRCEFWLCGRTSPSRCLPFFANTPSVDLKPSRTLWHSSAAPSRFGPRTGTRS